MRSYDEELLGKTLSNSPPQCASCLEVQVEVKLTFTVSRSDRGNDVLTSATTLNDHILSKLCIASLEHESPLYNSLS